MSHCSYLAENMLLYLIFAFLSVVDDWDDSYSTVTVGEGNSTGPRWLTRDTSLPTPAYGTQSCANQPDEAKRQITSDMAEL